MDNLQYLQAFLDESFENTQVLNDLCLAIEHRAPTDDDFATMFRAAHTLKGMSATMGFQRLATLTHRLEDALGYLRQHPDHLTGDVTDLLFAGVDALERHLNAIRSTGQEAAEDDARLVQRLSAILTGGLHAAAAEAAVTVPAQRTLTAAPAAVHESLLGVLKMCTEKGLVVGWLTVDLDPACQMKGPRAILVMRAIESHGQCLQCEPAAEIMESGTFEGGRLRFLVALETDPDTLVRAVNNIAEVTQVGFEVLDVNAQAAAAAQTANEVRTTGQGASGPGPVRTERLERTIRVPVERLDTLMNMLSELVIDKTRLEMVSRTLERTDLRELADHVSRITNDLQAAVMSLRMVPVDTLFQRFPRMVRDLAKSLGKEIHLDMTGMDTEFDRTVIDEMGEALVHLIRNSADHGLESPEDRRRAGKPSTGTISLRAYSSGQHVFIEVADDGRGIDVNKVRSRAIERKLIDAAAAERLTPNQVYDLLFESGFSTADQVSDISGRGVGLDAVRSKVESLGGRIDIESEVGRGTVFRIQLPLTLSILQALLVTVDKDVFAVPLGSVEEVVLASPDMLRNVHGNTVLQYRDRLVPIVDAGDWLLSRPSKGDPPWHLVICREGTRRLALAVDGFIGRQEIVHKSLGNYLKTLRWYAGATILGDGSIALILDVHAWIGLVSQ